MIVLFLNKKYKENINKLINLPIPVCVISIYSNKIICSNDEFKRMFENQNNKLKNILKSKLFYDTNDYFQIKKDINENKENEVNKRFVKLMINGEIKYFELWYFCGLNDLINNKNHIILSFKECGIIEKYVKYLGIVSSFIDELSDGIVIAKHDKNADMPVIVYANEAIKNITGYDSKDLINKPLSAMYSLNIDKNIFDRIKDNINNVKKFNIKYQYTKKNGEKCWIKSEFNTIDANKIDNILSSLNISYNCDEMPDMRNDVYITLHQINIQSSETLELSYQKFINKQQKHFSFMTEYFNIISNNNLSNKIKMSKIFQLIDEYFKSPRIFTIEFDNSLQFEINYEYLSNDIESMLSIIESNNLNIDESGLIELYGQLCNNKSVRINEKYTQKFYKYMEEKWHLIWKTTSSLLIPVIVDSELKMAIVLCDYNNRREWNDNEEQMMRTISLSIYRLLKGCTK